MVALNMAGDNYQVKVQNPGSSSPTTSGTYIERVPGVECMNAENIDTGVQRPKANPCVVHVLKEQATEQVNDIVVDISIERVLLPST
jgi:hypothetical protein